MTFQYASSWLDHPESVPLSHSLPLRKRRFSQRECRPYFGGVLPEGPNRTQIARALGVSEHNEFALLEKIGGECAGAVTLLPEGTRLDALTEDVRELDDEELAHAFGELPRRPLLVGTQNLRLSLAGAQDKFAVCVSSRGISLPPRYRREYTHPQTGESDIRRPCLQRSVLSGSGPRCRATRGPVPDRKRLRYRLPAGRAIRPPVRQRRRDRAIASGRLLPSPGQAAGKQVPERERTGAEAMLRATA